jgi:hypothetical protein
MLQVHGVERVRTRSSSVAVFVAVCAPHVANALRSDRCGMPRQARKLPQVPATNAHSLSLFPQIAIPW